MSRILGCPSGVVLALWGLLGTGACQGAVVFSDTFQAGIGPAYQTIGTASLSSSPGVLNVKTPNLGDGLTINLASIGVNTGRCIILGGLSYFSSTANVGDSFTIQATGTGAVNGTPGSFVFQDVFTQLAGGDVSANARVTFAGVVKVDGVIIKGPNNTPGSSYRIDILKGTGANGSDQIQDEVVTNDGRFKVIHTIDPPTITYDNFATLSLTNTAGTSTTFSMNSVTVSDLHTPEPSSITLCSIALLSLLCYRRLHRATETGCVKRRR